MSTDDVIVAQSQIKQNSSTKILMVLDKLTHALSEDLTEQNNTYVIEKRNIAMRVTLVNQTKNFATVIASNNEQGKINVDIQQDSGSTFDDGINGVIKLPKTVLQSYEKPIVRAINHRTAILFHTDKQLKMLADGKKLTGKMAASNVLSASLGEQKFESLAQPVTISFKNVSKSSGTGVCKFWDFDKGVCFFSWLEIKESGYLSSFVSSFNPKSRIKKAY